MDFDYRIDFRNSWSNIFHKESVEYWLLKGLMSNVDIYPESYNDDDIEDNNSPWDNYKLFHSEYGIFVQYNRGKDCFIVEKNTDWYDNYDSDSSEVDVIS